MAQLDRLIDAGNTVILVEHEMRVVASSDWVIDVGPGAGDEGGGIVAAGPPGEVAAAAASRTAPYLQRYLAAARRRRYDAARFSFNLPKGRCPTCEGEGFVSVEMLFLPSVYAPCPACHGARYAASTLEIRYRDRTIADVLAMTVDAAWAFFADEPHVRRSLEVLRDVGLGYLRLGQPATELSGGEAQRIKLATELQRPQRGDTLYVLDEPTTGLHPHDVEKLMAQLQGLVDAGNSVVVVEHELHVIAGSDWVIDMGPGAGDEGGRIVASAPPRELWRSAESRTARYLRLAPASVEAP
jgi:excinuclease ABC subunit A